MKNWWKSKTLWFNLVVALGTAAEASFNVLQPFVPGSIYAYISFGLIIGNAILRILTTQAIVPPKEGQ